MAFLPPMTGFAPPQFGQPAITPTRAVPPAFGAGMGATNASNTAAAPGQMAGAFGGPAGQQPAVEPTVDPSQFGIAQPTHEINPVQPLPGVRPSGVMPMQPSAGGAVRPPNAGFVHPAVGRLRGMPTNTHGRPY